ncbi:MAG: hypothetical protein SGJ20_17970 [Planctomycetota bacterium]|nr:hypothetical protein [Planctomycetota bacterium]
MTRPSLICRKHTLKEEIAFSVPLHRRSTSRGFTYFELLIILTVLAVLVALLLPAIQAARAAAQRRHALNNIQEVGAALERYSAMSQPLPVPPFNQDVKERAAEASPFPAIRVVAQNDSPADSSKAPASTSSNVSAKASPNVDPSLSDRMTEQQRKAAQKEQNKATGRLIGFIVTGVAVLIGVLLTLRRKRNSIQT